MSEGRVDRGLVVRVALAAASGLLLLAAVLAAVTVFYYVEPDFGSPAEAIGVLVDGRDGPHEDAARAYLIGLPGAEWVHLAMAEVHSNENPKAMRNMVLVIGYDRSVEASAAFAELLTSDDPAIQEEALSVRLSLGVD